MNLVKYQNIPLKAIPEEELNTILLTDFLTWISGLLSLEGETSAERLKNALPAIKEHCWQMGLLEVKKMFEMYADSKLGIEPKSNYLDRVLLGKIKKAYVQYNPKNADNKKYQNYINAIAFFDTYKQNGIITYEMGWLWDYLVLDQKVMPMPTKREGAAIMYNLRNEHPQKPKYQLVELAKCRSLEHWLNSIIAQGKHIKDLLN